jgi:D-alanyl-lipoteichoic acid acyltransferase DltB (MBOAT superfamily)
MVVFMERSATPSKRKLWLIISLVSNFGFLAFFKYSYFITNNINWIFEHSTGRCGCRTRAYPNCGALASSARRAATSSARVILPIGISFHTFQSMSYTIDAYYGRIETERSFVRFLTFVSFFPQLVAGPIERASNLLPQLQRTPGHHEGGR